MNHSDFHPNNLFLLVQDCAGMAKRNWLLWLSTNWRSMLYTLICIMLASGSAFGARISDVRGTKHNLSAAANGAAYPGGTVPTRTVKATSETEVCVFCHTPHGATLGVTPLWNRKLSDATYTPYTSSSLDANVLQGVLGQPGGSSKLCLSCHDGTLAIGSVNVLNGLGSVATPGTQTIGMAGVPSSGVMPDGSGATTGYTRNLGIDLTNDHPISVTYNNTLALRDGELRGLDTSQRYPNGTGSIIGLISPSLKPKAPLEPTATPATGDLGGQIQCSACHDPHLRDDQEATVGNQKFLRLNRFQQVAATIYTADFDVTNDINCVACHDKNNSAGTWSFSAHANGNQTNGANQTYTSTASTQREFPVVSGNGLPVWKVSCLNCHDTHTVQGARRLLREGTDSIATPKAGGNAATEETCYQCHSNDANTAITPLTTVPDIKSDFALSRHMPITLADQGNPASEAHDIGSNLGIGGTPYEWEDCTTTTNKCGADFFEKRTKLGAGTGNLVNRHAECTDCHNPHRAIKFRTFAPPSLSATPQSVGTHGDATDVSHNATSYIHTNIASGALRGTFGVEPVYGGATFYNKPTNYGVKRSDPGTNTSTAVTQLYVTREYQICLKCHSDYGYNDDNLGDGATTNRPALGGAGLTPSNTNNLTHYTNQAKELYAPTAHKGEVTTSDSGAYKSLPYDYQNNNHRSWHPVMDDTGRNAATRGITATQVFSAPWSNSGAVGTQTMYCSDCHGSNVSPTVPPTVIPNAGEAGGAGNSWGPHGSSNDFILKGLWNSSTGDGQTNGLCFKCHDYASYATGTGNRTGFWTTDNGGNDGHQLHFNKIGKMRCVWCHVAVPHGWKNKGLLVNLNDVYLVGGEAAEAGTGASSEVQANTTTAYNSAPYYLNARLKIINFKTSGNWTANDCGSSGRSGNGQVGKTWMSASGVPPANSENCANPP